MKILFIDTHMETINISLISDDKIISKNKTSDRSHSEITIPIIIEALKEANISINQIDEIIVVNGPGSFTGVRIGVTIAKTIAYSLNIPIKTITSLEAYGISAKEEFDVVTVNDTKGVYSALHKEGRFIEFSYRKNQDFKKYIDDNGYNVLKDNNYDLKKIIDYLKNKESTNPHNVNPIYIKEIDALK